MGLVMTSNVSVFSTNVNQHPCIYKPTGECVESTHAISKHIVCSMDKKQSMPALCFLQTHCFIISHRRRQSYTSLYKAHECMILITTAWCISMHFSLRGQSTELIFYPSFSQAYIIRITCLFKALHINFFFLTLSVGKWPGIIWEKQVNCLLEVQIFRS